MAKATVQPTCGLVTVVEAVQVEPQRVTISIESECKAIRKLGEAVSEVNPYQEMTFRGGEPRLLAAGREFCSHTSCPVPVAILKAVEVAAGLDLPKAIRIEITQD